MVIFQVEPNELATIELCNNHNTVQGDTINGSAMPIHIDSSCTNFGSSGNTGSGNTISGMTLHGACAGILSGTMAGSNTIGTNTFFNAVNTTLTADQCPAPVALAALLGAMRLPGTGSQRHAAPARP